MGCAGSTSGGGRRARTTDNNNYYNRHPGLRNHSRNGIESEITRHVRELPAEDKTLIEVLKVDLDVETNSNAHHTNEYDVVEKKKSLVIRRGQEFNINIEFNRPYDSQKDDLRIVFQFGKNPRPSVGTHAEFILSEKDKPKQWGAYINSKEGNSLNLVLNSSPSCPVGKWSLKIDVVKRAENSVEVFRYTHTDDIYILFNPWCKDDFVYMYEEKLLKEYILNETGKIYSGSYKKISPKPWVFGQFEENMLDCSLLLLEVSGLLDNARGNPIAVVRKISQMVNSSDDDGVLTGNWSGDYAGGTSPLNWPGSVDILNEYYSTKRPVKFGQCWVFSGIVTTVCRALGIPARSVTNFASAHDTDGSITIDYHYNEKMEPLEDENNDSVWNFHVWNDVWLARPDLPNGYGGWQAIDATPQETSDGVYCMGPMSLLAIKRGELFYPYDGPFCFAEVNSDRVYWKMSESGAMEKVYVNKYSIGKSISTKRPSSDEREDVTDQYKFKEGSDEERTAVRQANQKSTLAGFYETKAEDVTFELKANPDVFMGDTMKYCLELKNTSSDKRVVNGTLSLASSYYTGVTYRNIRDFSIDGTVLQPGEQKCIDVEVGVDEYLDKLTDHCICKISCMCLVEETKQTFANLDELRLRKPHLTIKAPETGKVGNEFEVEVSFVNPLPVTLTNCELRVDGPGVQKPTKYKQQNVNAGATYTGKFNMCPKKPGDREIVVYFNCTQIYAVNISHQIKINP
ncbi:hemocyte protein-glutamine gamma-glutamyltransferase-like isoform X2 [Ruditapes philippinarum]|uniref:hemocyte protein-glutamine gamma-glutamyltransferase-like isoform X2 n=1 Tax=Ruditapes philippinarum TaxID=129788 RepID=UPI00295B3ED2|nr:hemocyte protein-glutamine gamma-glutamyltransferase-like isoform X2 [Ruditapes philippinarum]